MQAIRVVLTASFLGLFGFAGLFANCGASPSASSDLKKTENQLNMPNSVSTLLTRNLNDVFGENDPVRRRKAIDEIFTQDAVFYDPKGGVIVAATRSTASRANSGLRTVTFGISQLASPKKWEMADAFDGQRVAPVRRQ